MDKLDKVAQQDAYAIGMAKLLAEDVDWKTDNILGYKDALVTAYDKLDMSRARDMMVRSHKKIVKAGGIGVQRRFRKTRTVILIAGVVYVLEKNGVFEPIKRKYRRAVLATTPEEVGRKFAKATSPAIIKAADHFEIRDEVLSAAEKVSDKLRTRAMEIEESQIDPNKPGSDTP